MQIKKVICHCANFEQLKKIFVILLTCFKSEKDSHALENKKVFYGFSLETFLQRSEFYTMCRLSVL